MSEAGAKTHPLRVERFSDDKGVGWFFVSCDAIPGASSFGPDLGEVFKSLESAAADLLKQRGIDARVTIEPIIEHEQGGEQVPQWGALRNFEHFAKIAA